MEATAKQTRKKNDSKTNSSDKGKQPPANELKRPTWQRRSTSNEKQISWRFSGIAYAIGFSECSSYLRHICSVIHAFLCFALSIKTPSTPPKSMQHFVSVLQIASFHTAVSIIKSIRTDRVLQFNEFSVSACPELRKPCVKIITDGARQRLDEKIFPIMF